MPPAIGDEDDDVAHETTKFAKRGPTRRQVNPATYVCQTAVAESLNVMCDRSDCLI